MFIDTAAKLARKVLTSKKVVALTSPNASTSAAAIAKYSAVTKDAVNCYYYVTQSLANERIPEEKRKFVAGLDLSNGILNVILQLAIGTEVEKCSGKFFDKFISPKYFSDKAIAKMHGSIGGKLQLKDFAEKMLKNKSLARSGLAVISTLAATQIIAKRMIVPLIATPFASYFKKKFDEKEVVSSDQVTFSSNFCSKPENIPKCFESFMQ